MRSAARGSPNHHAICFRNARYTCREANRLAHALRSLGLNIGEQVAILLPNLPQLIIAFHGTLKAAGVAMLASRGNKKDLKHQIADAEVRVRITPTTQADPTRRLQRELGVPHLLPIAPGATCSRSGDSPEGCSSSMSSHRPSLGKSFRRELARRHEQWQRKKADPRAPSCALFSF
ncbi:MAG: AMP-binding protein [Thermoflexus sp.]|nr:AMP-binding protein [Thermoflexus sp.]